MTVGSNLSGGFALLRNHPGAVAIWAVLYAALNLGLVLLMQPMMMQAVVVQQAAQTGAAAPAGAFNPFAMAGPMLLFYVVLLVALVAIFAAVVRAVTQGGSDRFGFLRLGMDELRLIGLGVIFIIGFFAVYMVGALMLAVVAGGAAAASPTTGIVLGVIGGIALLCFLVWLQVRFSLTGVMTVMQGRIVIADGWRATRGHFWTLLGTSLVLFLIIFFVALVFAAISNPALLSLFSGGGMQGFAAAQQAQLAELAKGMSVMMLIQAVVGGAVNTIALAVYYGAIATAAADATASSHAGRNLEEVFS